MPSTQTKPWLMSLSAATLQSISPGIGKGRGGGGSNGGGYGPGGGWLGKDKRLG